MTTGWKDIIINTTISVVVTIVSGYYFFHFGNKERRPTFHVEPIRKILVHKHQLERESLPIKDNIVLVFFYFFNQGKQAIARRNVYSRLQIKVGGPSERIIEYGILKRTRDQSKITLVKDTAYNNCLNLDFLNLEQNEGFAGKLIFEGNKEAKISISGGIEEAIVIEERLAHLDNDEIFQILFLTLTGFSVILIFLRKLLGPIKLFCAILLLSAAWWSLNIFAPDPKIYSKENIVPENLDVKEANPFPNGHPLPGQVEWDDYRKNYFYFDNNKLN